MSAQLVRRQNLDHNIERLAAQSGMYTHAKRLYYRQLKLDILVPIGTSLLSVLVKKFAQIDISWLPTVVALIILLVDELYLTPLVNRFKTLAAKTQEQFDCEVLSLGCHPMVGAFADQEDVHRFAKQYRSDRGNCDDLIDWYGTVISHVPAGIDKVICQRASVKYDHSLRTSFMEYIGWRCWLPAIMLYLIIGFSGMSFADFVKLAILPSIPLIKFFFQARATNAKSLTRTDEVKRKANETWKKVVDGIGVDYDKMAEVLQYEIYMNRKESLLIPDSLYREKRTGLEEDMNASVRRLVDEYNRKGKGPDINL